MKHYYGLADSENNGWGFVEEGDGRITDDFVELTEEEWQTLLDEQAEGKEIAGYGVKCFTAEKNHCYIDDAGAF